MILKSYYEIPNSDKCSSKPLRKTTNLSRTIMKKWNFQDNVPTMLTKCCWIYEVRAANLVVLEKSFKMSTSLYLQNRPRYIRERALQRTRTINFNYHPLSAAQNVVVLLNRSRTTKLWVDPTQRRRSSSSFWFSLWRATWPFAFLPICRERSARTAISPAGLHRFSNSKLKSRYVFQVDL